jgi:hypothetical protein
LLLEDTPLKTRRRKKPTDTNISSHHRSGYHQWTADQCRDLVNMETKFLDYDFTKHPIAQPDLRLGSQPSGVNEVAGNMGNARNHALNAVANRAEPVPSATENTKDIGMEALKYY